MQLALVAEESVPTRPVLRFRDDRGFWLFVPNDSESVIRLRRLARHHVFEVAHDRETIFVAQGHRPENVPKNFLAPRYQDRHQILHVFNDCRGCRVSCVGPRFSSPEVSDGDRRPDDVMDELRDSLPKNVVCPMFVDGRASVVTIDDRLLRSLGWEPLSASRAFTDPCVRDEPDTVFRLQGVDLGDPEAVARALGSVVWYDNVIADGFHPNTRSWRHGGGSLFSDLFFDEDLIALNRLRSRVRALANGRRRRDMKAYRREHCSRCVYSCEKPPWHLDHPSPLTREQIMDENVPAPDDRQWMAVFKVCGLKGNFVNPETGYQVSGIGNRPGRLGSGDWGVEISRLAVGAKRLETIPVSEYLDRVYGPDVESPVLRPLDDETLRHTFWALRQINDITSHNIATFDVGGRHMENVVYHITLDDRFRDYDPSGPRITVGSDTRATHHGGFGYGGSHIAMSERPRFVTEYTHPHFADGIWSWYTQAPGACGGRKK